MSLMDGMNHLHRLHFDDDPAFDDEINAIPNFEFLAFISHGKGKLSRDLKPAILQFMREAGLVSAFEEARPQQRVDFHRGIYNNPCDFVNTVKTGAS